MNQKRLNTVFENYIAKFEYMNSDTTKSDLNEKYKWEIAFGFKSEMDDALNASDALFPVKLSGILTHADNLLSNSQELPKAALCDYVKAGEAETVRDLLRLLLADDGGNLALRQKHIDEFILGCNGLREKHFPNSYKYIINQRVPMVIRGLYYPELDYIYKATEASAFADYVEFYDSFGTYSDFKMPAYYRMCDQLTEAMRNNEMLMKKHSSRSTASSLPMHSDTNLHILAFDLIFCSYHYFLAAEKDYRISSEERRLYLENQNKASRAA